MTEIQVNHIAFDGRDPVEEAVEAVEEAGVCSPVGFPPQVVPGPTLGAVQVKLGEVLVDATLEPIRHVVCIGSSVYQKVSRS